METLCYASIWLKTLHTQRQFDVLIANVFISILRYRWHFTATMPFCRLIKILYNFFLHFFNTFSNFFGVFFPANVSPVFFKTIFREIQLCWRLLPFFSLFSMEWRYERRNVKKLNDNFSWAGHNVANQQTKSHNNSGQKFRTHTE